MASLASKNELHFRRAADAERRSEPPSPDDEAREARDVDDAGPDDTVLHNRFGIVAGVAAALASMVLGAAAGLGYLQAPLLNAGPESEQLPNRWRLDPETARAFAAQAKRFAAMAPGVTAEPTTTAAEGHAAPESEVAPAPNVTAPRVGAAPEVENAESASTDNPY